jgi:hypothetical protein
MRAFHRISNELELSSMPVRMQRAAWLRKDRVNQEYQRSTRVVGRILQTHEGRPREAGGSAADGGRQNEMECQDKFLADHEPAGRPE